VTVAVGNAVGAASSLELFRSSTAHTPSYFALGRAGGGNSDIVDFCIPCNPYFPTPEMFDRLTGMLRDILTYYPSSAETVIAELSSTLGLNPQTVAMGNGSTELITWIDHLLVRDSLAVPIPTFGRWTDQPMETGKRVDMFLLPEAGGFALDPAAFVSFIRARGSRTAVICNPNNPDGGYLPRHAVIGMLDALSDLDLVIVDESFMDFVDAEANPSVADEAALRPNVVVLRSLGKNFGLHGIRFGYMVANPAIAGKVRRALPKWNLNSFAEVVVFMIKEYRQEYAQSLRMLSRDRQEMTWQLAALPGMTVFPSQGNFVFVKLPDGVEGGILRDRLLAEHGVLVRECGNKLGSSSRFMRLVVRSQPDVQRLLTGLSTVIYGSTWYAAPPAAAAPPAPPVGPQYHAQVVGQESPAYPAAPPAPEPPALYAAQPAQPEPTAPQYAPQPAPEPVAASMYTAQPVQQQPQVQYAQQQQQEYAQPYAAQQQPAPEQLLQMQQPPPQQPQYQPEPQQQRQPQYQYQAPPEQPQYQPQVQAQPQSPPQSRPQAYPAQAAYMTQGMEQPPRAQPATQAVQETAVFYPDQTADVPPAFFPAQRTTSGVKPALYWQDA
jgi:histidinol-phosphate/aromatic aminotransferase/cobyric acid decarboxylase-like protein